MLSRLFTEKKEIFIMAILLVTVYCRPSKGSTLASRPRQYGQHYILLPYLLAQTKIKSLHGQALID